MSEAELNKSTSIIEQLKGLKQIILIKLRDMQRVSRLEEIIDLQQKLNAAEEKIKVDAVQYKREIRDIEGVLRMAQHENKEYAIQHEQDTKTIFKLAEERDAFERAIREAREQEPTAWFVFADSNGLIPLELFGFDEKECKHKVLTYARQNKWKGSLDGYLLSNNWVILPVYTECVPEMPIQDDVKEGFAIIEAALKKVSSGDLSEAPFPMTGDTAKSYLAGAASAYQHCLEMCNVPEVKPSC